MNKRRSEADRTLDFKALDSQNIALTEHVTALQEQNEYFRSENEKVKQYYKELYDSITITRAKAIEKKSSLLTENEKLKAQLKGKMECVTMNTVKPKVLAPEVDNSTEASGSKPRSNTKNNRFLPAKSDNKKKVEDHPRNNKSKLKQENRVDSSINHKRTVVQIIPWYLDSGYSKHMTRNRSRLKNFMKKFIRTVRFENDHFGAIIGYRDYVIGDSVISSVYYVEGLGHNLFSIDYTLWEVIENGATLPKTTTVEGVVTEMPITTVEEKAQRRLEDAKLLLEAIEKRFSGNEATKKTQRNLLKQ
ncbi:hypothetical protein Tco_1228349 [Tanacetum coccineum]